MAHVLHHPSVPNGLTNESLWEKCITRKNIFMIWINQIVFCMKQYFFSHQQKNFHQFLRSLTIINLSRTLSPTTRYGNGRSHWRARKTNKSKIWTENICWLEYIYNGHRPEIRGNINNSNVISILIMEISNYNNNGPKLIAANRLTPFNFTKTNYY